MRCRRERASHPVGTTVRATNLFQNFPVRVQANSKESPKTLVKIKKMLQAYALARPTVRISFKVLKAKSQKGNFMYAPKAGGMATIEDAVLKIFGSGVTTECEWTVLANDGFKLHAFLPRQDANSSKIANMGQFVSIDLRPMSALRGTLKQVVNIFKEALRKSSERMEGVKDPLLVLNLACPPTVYDPNIEPAKDNVLFDNGEKVVKIFQMLLESFYLESEKNVAKSHALSTTVDEAGNIPRTSIALDERTNKKGESAKSLHDVNEPQMLEGNELAFREQRQTAPRFKSNMYGCDDEDLELALEHDYRPSIRDQRELAAATKDVNLTNPWTIARLTGGRRTSAPGHDDQPTPSLLFDETSYDVGGIGVMSDELEGAIIPRHDDQIHRRDFAPASDLIHVSPHMAENMLPTPPISSSPALGTPLDTMSVARAPKRQRRERGRGNVNRPSVSPLQPHTRRDLNWFDFGQLESCSQPPRRPRQVGQREGQDIRDFLAPAARGNALPLVTQGQVEQPIPFLPSSIAIPTQPELGAMTEAGTEDLAPSNQAMQDRFAQETRAKPTAPQRRKSKKLSRSKSAQLPLESILESDRTQNLRLIVHLIPAEVSKVMGKLDHRANHLKWATIPDPPASMLSRLVGEEEVEIWLKRLTGYLHASFHADDDFSGLQGQTEESFARVL